ncbi:MAG: class I SAM-dependent methyltransferase [Cellulosilyticaceae bacterium]
MQGIINYYNHYNEDERITSSPARKVEFFITTHLLDQYIQPKDTILEIGCGTGVYAFYYATKGHDVVATDLTPSYIDQIHAKQLRLEQPINLTAAVANATDLSAYQDASFDFVTCFGPLYHLVSEADRIQCLREALRVLKPGGFLAIAYINKHYMIHHVMLRDKQYLNKAFIDKVLGSGTLREGEKECFWTDSYFTTPSEIEAFLAQYNVRIVSHIATDGMTPFVRSDVDAMTDEEYSQWLYYLLHSCHERDILGMSNHALVLLQKEGVKDV